jgi:hypothetical protein
MLGLLVSFIGAEAGVDRENMVSMIGDREGIVR